jgi:serine/threonine protein kinase
MAILCKIKSNYLSEYYETYDADDKYVYLVMEYIEGESLMDILCK